MKKLSRMLKTVLCLTLCCSSLTAVGCFGGGGGGDSSLSGGTPDSPDSVDFNVGVYDGGLGSTWLQIVGNAFEEYCKDMTFEGGKKGINFKVTAAGTERFGTSALSNNISADTEICDVVFTAEDYRTFVNNGVCLEITDIVSTAIYGADGNLAATGATTSIYDKMDPYFQDCYAINGKYYGLPFEDSVMGLIYDKDLFTQKGWELPTEMDDFYDLLDIMVSQNVIPFTWANVDFYWPSLTASVYAQYEGADSVKQDMFYNGTYKGETITEANAYKLADKTGYLKAYEFLRAISKKEYIYKQAFANGTTQTQAQADFLTSVLKAQEPGGKRIAMLLDGDWWENEAKETFRQMGGDYAYGKRNFEMFPIPTMEGQTSTKRTLYGFSGGDACFINKNTDLPELSKLFLKFFAQNSSLATFTAQTGSCLAYDYTVSPEQYNDLTTFAKSIYDLRRDPNVEIVRDTAMCTFRRDFNTKLGLSFKKNVKNFYDDQTLTAEAAYNAQIAAYPAADWIELYNEFSGN